MRSEHLTEPILVLKADAGLPYETDEAVLDDLRGILDQVVLLTRLDISDTSLITAETWLGGLPGGIVLPLGSADDDRLAGTRDGSEVDAMDDDPPPAEPEGPIHVGGDVRPPQKIHAPAPEYTDVARKARIQGVVIVQVVIDAEGNVTDVKVLKGPRSAWSPSRNGSLTRDSMNERIRWRFGP